MRLDSVLSFAKRLVADRLQAGDGCVDATVGNGVDTLFLAERVGAGGAVFGFDIQTAALEQAMAKLEKAGCAAHIWRGDASASASMGASMNTVRLLLASHEHMTKHIPQEWHGRLSAVMFNLGYLPGGDHRIMTKPDSSVRALEAAFSLLSPGGIITVVIYTGHEGGTEEELAVRHWALGLDQKIAQVLDYRFINQQHKPPYLIAICKAGA
jgi:SAM-dependent methyltransferase